MLLNGTLFALVMGGAILPLMYVFQNVQGLKPVPALLRIVPMVIVAAACSPFVGGIMARRGPTTRPGSRPLGSTSAGSPR